MSQVGSRCDKVDYDIHNVVAYLSADYTVNENLRFFGDITYTYSKADADDPHFGNPFDTIDLGGHVGPSHTPTNDPWFVITYTGDMDGMSDWYDLEMERVDATVGFDWTVWKNLSITTNFTYRWYDDQEEYLYEDTDGEVYILNTGLTWRF